MSNSCAWSRRALAILVAEDGSIENRVVATPAGMPASTFVEASNFLSARIRGRTLAEVTAEIEAARRDARKELDDIAARLVEAGLASWSGAGGSGDQLIVRGQANLLGDLRASDDLERIRTLFADLETKTDVIELLHRAETGDGVKIFIGSENKLFSLSGSSMIAAPLQGQRPSHRRRARRHRADPAQLRPHRADGRICRAGARRPQAPALGRRLTSFVARRYAMSNASNVGTSQHSLGEAIERLRGKWAAITAFGVLLVVLGFAALVFSLVATIATVTLNGVLFLIAGAAEIGIGMHSRSWGRFFLWVIGGLLYVAAGILCIVNPILASVVLTLMLGAGLIAAGVVRVYLATQLPADQPRALVFLAAAVTILLGLIIVTSLAARQRLCAGRPCSASTFCFTGSDG